MEVDSLVWYRNYDQKGRWKKGKVSKIEPLKVKTLASTKTDQESFQFEIIAQEETLRATECCTIISSPAEGSCNEFIDVKLRNLVDDETPDGVNDLVSLNYLHEPAILWTLKMRFERDIIYTSTGPILISINPFKRLDLYSGKTMNHYRNSSNSESDLLPHVFKVADAAFSSMAGASKTSHDLVNQSVLVSGESGAGKTECTKLIMKYLAEVISIHPPDITKDMSKKGKCIEHRSVEHLLLQSNPILESFGNSRTVRNDNSSRFGKFIEILFNPLTESKHGWHIVGARIRTYLLEKVRLVSQAKDERNFHCFYEYLRGCPSNILQDRGLSASHDYHYINQSGCVFRKDGVNDAEQYEILQNAFIDLGFSEAEISFVLDMVAAILHLGNISFDPVSDTDESCGYKIKRWDRDHAHFVCSLMGFSCTDLENALCRRVLVTAEDTVTVNLTLSEAQYARDSISKIVYASLFEWLVHRINSVIFKSGANVLSPTHNRSDQYSSPLFIGVLDIFGFENFEKNSFEQICINYTNETLQQHFNQFVFEYEQSLYDKEKINWSHVAFPDNSATLDLLDNRQKGVFAICDEQSKFQWANSTSLVNRLCEVLNGNSKFQCNNSDKARNRFSICHYAGLVCYDAQQFIEKNNDVTSADMVKLLLSTNNSQLAEVIQILGHEDSANSMSMSQYGKFSDVSQPTKLGSNSQFQSPNRRASLGDGNRIGQSLGLKFRRQLRDLMTTVSLTKPHYVRCIKPNALNAPNLFDDDIVSSQLRCCGVLEAVRVSRFGFPNRFGFEDFYRNYRCVVSSCAQRECRNREQAIKFCNIVTHTLMREKVGRVIASDVSNGESTHVVDGLHLCETIGIEVGVSLVFLRRNTFDMLEILKAKIHRAAVIKLQSIYRCHRCQSIYVQSRSSAMTIQRSFRVYVAQQKLSHLRKGKASLTLQRSMRGWIARIHVWRLYRQIILVQCAVRRRMARKQLLCLLQRRAATVISAVYKRFCCLRRYRKFYRTIVTLQCLFRRRIAKKTLKNLREEARSLKKIIAERDELARQVAMWEERFSLLEQSQSLKAKSTEDEPHCDVVVPYLPSARSLPDLLEDSHSVEGQYYSLDNVESRKQIAELQQQLSSSHSRIKQLEEMNAELMNQLSVNASPREQTEQSCCGAGFRETGIIRTDASTYPFLLLQRSYIDVDLDSSTPYNVIYFFRAVRNSNSAAIVYCLYTDPRLAQFADRNGCTALHMICGSNLFGDLGVAIVTVLLELQSNPNAQDGHGATPLVYAAANSRWDLCTVLLKYGGDLNKACSFSTTLKFLVREREDIPLLQWKGPICVANDFVPSEIFDELVIHISARQSVVDMERRSLCMQCYCELESYSLWYRIFGYTSKVHCSCCQRVVCADCCVNHIQMCDLPYFAREFNSSVPEYPVCNACYRVLCPPSSS